MVLKCLNNFLNEFIAQSFPLGFNFEMNSGFIKNNWITF